MINTPLTKQQVKDMLPGSYIAAFPNRRFRRGAMKMNADLRFFKGEKSKYQYINRDLYWKYRRKEALLSRKMKNKQIPII